MIVVNYPLDEIIKILDEGEEIIVNAIAYNDTGEKILMGPALYPVQFSNKNWIGMDFTVKSKTDNSDIPFERSADGWTIIVNDGPELGIVIESV